MPKPKISVEYRPIEKLIPYANNSRTHSDEQIAQIAASIKEFGWTNPVLVDGENGIIAGHGRVLAARKLGIKDAPCIELHGLSEAQKKAYIIADNKLALNADWDNALLGLELAELDAQGFDITLTGFSGDELAALTADKTEGLTDPDDVPEPPANPVTSEGDLWFLGDHRLLCGDCTKVEAVDALLAGVKPHLMVTDPPYGVKYDAGWRDVALVGNRWSNDHTATGGVANDGNADWREAWALFPGDVAYVWHAGNKANIVAEGLMESGFNLRAQIIWVKNHMVIGRGDYHPKHEPCWYAVKKNRKGHYHGGRKQTTVWEIDKPRKSETGHSTQKPVECMRRPIENNSSPGQAIYEPFSGSGTTIIAAEMEGRHCYAMEISPEYVDVAVKRWQDFTGETAVRESDGCNYNDLAG